MKQAANINKNLVKWKLYVRTDRAADTLKKDLRRVQCQLHFIYALQTVQ